VRRRFLAGIGLGTGLAWLLRRLLKPQPAPVADPAEKLKQRLEESRATESEPSGGEREPPASLDERRRAVHDRARASIDDMHGHGTPPEA
jgi:hypothetical protein